MSNIPLAQLLDTLRSPVLPARCQFSYSSSAAISWHIQSISLLSVSDWSSWAHRPPACAAFCVLFRVLSVRHSGIRFGAYGLPITSVCPTSVRSVISVAYQLVRNVAASFSGLNSFFLPREFRHPCPYGLCIHICHVETSTESMQIRRSPYVTLGSR